MFNPQAKQIQRDLMMGKPEAEQHAIEFLNEQARLLQEQPAKTPLASDSGKGYTGKNANETIETGETLSKNLEDLMVADWYHPTEPGILGDVVKVGGAGETLNKLPKTTAESVSSKLDTYLLEPTHPAGGSKAQWFKEALGFTKGNSVDLSKQIVFDPKKAIQTATNAYGTKFSQIISVHGANGKIIDVEFIFIQNNDGVIRLVTSIPAKQ
jgi:hypothetical protein